MNDRLTDSTGAPVEVHLDEDSASYVITVGSGAVAGHAYFLPGLDAGTERIFHHTVVDKEFSGRGLSKVLVAEALADSRSRDLTVVPVCPLFVKKLQSDGDDYVASGGRFRKATPADLELVRRTAE